MKKLLTASALLGLLLLGAGQVEAQNLLVNGNLDLGMHEVDTNLGWTLTKGPNTMPLPPGIPMPANAATFASFADQEPSATDPTGGVGLWFRSFQGGLNAEQPPQVFANLTQRVPGVAGRPYRFSGWAMFETFYAGGVNNLNLGTGAPDPTADGPPSPTDTFFAIDFLGAADAVLNTIAVELKANGQVNQPSGSPRNWRQHSVTGIAPAGTLNVQVRASMVNGLGNPNVNPQSAFVDDFSLVVVPEPASIALSLIALLGVFGLTRRR